MIPDGLPRLAWQLASATHRCAGLALHCGAGRRCAGCRCCTPPAAPGAPKGVANNQQALLQRVAQYVNACHLHAGDRMLTLSSPCTIAGTREGLTALLTGATLHVIDTQQSGLGSITRRIRDAGSPR